MPIIVGRCLGANPVIGFVVLRPVGSKEGRGKRRVLALRVKGRVIARVPSFVSVVNSGPICVARVVRCDIAEASPSGSSVYWCLGALGRCMPCYALREVGALGLAHVGVLAGGPIGLALAPAAD